MANFFTQVKFYGYFLKTLKLNTFFKIRVRYAQMLLEYLFKVVSLTVFYPNLYVKQNL
jgi:hypothetical protein